MSESPDPTDGPDAGASDGEGSGSGSGNGMLVALVLVVVLGALAVVAVLLSNADEEEVVSDDGSTTESTLPAPGATDPDEPATSEPLGADSPLVGLTETEVRERYVLVRVVEVDGEPLAATMDLQQGRINLALEGDTVVGATVEGCDEVGDDTPEWVLQACDPDPDSDGPTTFGKLLADPDGGDELSLEVGTQGDQYHQGMVIRPAGDETRVVTTGGAPISIDDLVPDDVVYVWTGAACRESSPVQCDIHAVVVDRGTP